MSNHKSQGSRSGSVTLFGEFFAWMSVRPRWPKVIGLLMLVWLLVAVRPGVMAGYFAVTDGIVGGNTPMAVVFGWLPGGGALISFGVYLLYAPFLRRRGRVVWTLVNLDWLAFGLMAVGSELPPQAHPAFEYGQAASLAAVPGLLALGYPLMLVAMFFAWLVGLVSKRAKARLFRERTREEQTQLIGWSLSAVSLLWLAFALLAALG